MENYNKQLSEKQLREYAREIYNILHGTSNKTTKNPFKRGNDRVVNCIVHIDDYIGFNYDIDRIDIYKDFEKRGVYIVKINNNDNFKCEINTKTSASEIYVLLADIYDLYTKQFIEYDLLLSNNEKITIRTNINFKNLKNYYMNKILKENTFYTLLPINEDLIYPKVIKIQEVI